MATTAPNLTCRISNTSELNALFGGFSSALTTVGLTRVGGSVTWGAVAWVNASNTTYGYEVFKLDDPPAGASAVFIKITYKSSASAMSIPTMTLEVGTSWNSGTGAIEGTGAGNILTMLGGTSDATARPCIFSSDGDGLVIAAFWNSPSTSVRFLLLIDRQRGPDGSADPISGWPTPTGFCRFFSKGGSTSLMNLLLVDPAADDATALTFWPAITRGDLTATRSMLTTVAPTGVMPVYSTFLATLQGTYVSKLIVTYSLQDCPVGADLVIDHLGAPRHYTTLSSQFAFLGSRNEAGAAGAIWTAD